MINLDGTQTVNDICQHCMITGVNCIVNVHLEHGRTLTYHLDDARVCYIVYRMEMWVDSNEVVLDLYNY